MDNGRPNGPVGLMTNAFQSAGNDLISSKGLIDA